MIENQKINKNKEYGNGEFKKILIKCWISFA